MGEEDLASLADCARAVTAAYGLSGGAAVTRADLERWHRYATRNGDGDPAPRAVVTLPPRGRQPQLLFRPGDWVAWFRPGIRWGHRRRQDGGGGLAGFAGCARAVTAAFGLSGAAAVTRQGLERWYQRGTLNAAGDPPPRPAQIRRHVKRTQPKVLFRPGDWAEWARPGVPAPGSSQRRPRFETPAERQARYTPLDG